MTLTPALSRVLPLLSAGFRTSGVRTWTGRDGYGFQFTLVYQGAKVALVSQEGHGGPTRIEWYGLNWQGKPLGGYDGETPAQAKKRVAASKASKPAFDKLAEIVAATPADTSMPGEPLKVDDEWLMDDLLAYNDVVKLCKKKTVFLMPGEERKGSYRYYNAPFDARMKAHVEGKNPGATILNEVIAPYV